MESVIKQVGIYAPEGQKYVPHDIDMVLSYRENKKDDADPRRRHHQSWRHGQLHRHWLAYQLPRSSMAIPFCMYYSMFGFQRIGDMAWAFADSRGKGFLMGGFHRSLPPCSAKVCNIGTVTRPCFPAQSPTCITCDACLASEVAVILRDGLHHARIAAAKTATACIC